ncbi:phage integrase SAM-like domain-containing protein [Sphingomonas sp. YR710]|uniref:phage integrase SAM-like domain-containing protein n=1 Tax=Sphingomonas sp. YR710 TaxID=1882773 RepID=UPI000B855D24|nr:phage integrase SAM-like domain-containing protein [Sphingomonas sp. YR710]
MASSQQTAACQEMLSLPVVSRSVTIQQVCDRYLGDPTVGRTQKSLVGYRTTYSTILAIIGPEMPVENITREVCRELLSVLQELPSNARKRWPKLSPREAAAKAKVDRTPSMSSANINEYMNKFSTLLNWAVKEGLLGRNPAKGLRLAEALAPAINASRFRSSSCDAFLMLPFFVVAEMMSATLPLSAQHDRGALGSGHP